MTIDYKNLCYKKNLVRVINKNYDRSVKEILSESARRNPHTKVSSSFHLSPATGGNKNSEYSIELSKTYPIGGKEKTPRICKAI